MWLFRERALVAIIGKTVFLVYCSVSIPMETLFIPVLVWSNYISVFNFLAGRSEPFISKLFYFHRMSENRAKTSEKRIMGNHSENVNENTDNGYAHSECFFIV